ncbi:MAG: nitroreductase, partial [Acidobacteriota bacterium]
MEQRAGFAGSSMDYFLIGLTSIHWREAWKYGERAYRYCHHDLGHAISAVRLSAAMLGWQAAYRQEFSESEVAVLLGLSRGEDFHEAEDEYAECLIVVSAAGKPANVEQMFLDLESANWQGTANRLSESHVEWKIIDEVAKAARKPRTVVPESGRPCPPGKRFIVPASQPAEQIIQQRRSCLGLDGKTRISRDVFFNILTRTLPERTAIPFDVFSESLLIEPRIHFAVFVHRVDGIVPGLYFLIRNPLAETNLRAALNPAFLWTQPVPDFPLHLLKEGDFTHISSGIACGQDLAGDGVFSLGMIAEFEDSIRSTGPWLYPRLFWEAGLIGQVLYLEAEAAGIRGTGIGCYYDDPMHELLGIKT